MKKSVKLILLPILTCLVFAGDQADESAFAQFIGDWSGDGHFYNTDMNNQLGTLRFTLRVSPEIEITGTVGNAEIVDGEIEVDTWNDGYMIKATLLGKIDHSKDFEKKRITFLLNEVNDDISEGDFHIANNYIFDFTMRPGAITLQRNP